MATVRHNAVADFSCEVLTLKERGRRVELALTPAGGSPVEFDMAATMAERLAYRLHYLCRCANVDVFSAGSDLSYPADEVKLRFDPVTGAGRLSFSSRASQTIHVQLSLDGLIELRNLLTKVK